MTNQTNTPATDRLAARVERDAYYSPHHHGYVLPHGSIVLSCGNAAALGVQVRHLITHYPRIFRAAAAEAQS